MAPTIAKLFCETWNTYLSNVAYRISSHFSEFHNVSKTVDLLQRETLMGHLGFKLAGCIPPDRYDELVKFH